MRLAALVEKRNNVCCRYRLKAFEPALRTAGYDLELHELPRSLWDRWSIGAPVHEHDAVILQRRLLSTLECGLLQRRVRRLLFDFDDALWLRDSYATKGFQCSKRQKRFRSIISRCDAVIAGNEYLAEEAARWSTANSIHVIPTCVDETRYPLAAHEQAGNAIHLVWIGSSSTLRGLELIAPILEGIGKAVPGIRLKLICDRFLKLKFLPIVQCAWAEATEAREIASSDIGISWIPDDPWSRGKCGLKVLQFMAAGLPVVANPVGVQVNMVRHGETGFLARSAAEWLEAVNLLAGDPDLRRNMGACGRRLVEEQYSVAAGMKRWLAVLQRLHVARIPA